jgi:hypothetical protein
MPPLLVVLVLVLVLVLLLLSTPTIPLLPREDGAESACHPGGEVMATALIRSAIESIADVAISRSIDRRSRRERQSVTLTRRLSAGHERGERGSNASVRCLYVRDVCSLGSLSFC